MNYLRLSLTAGALTLVFALPVFAGEMDTPGAPPSPPPVGSEIVTPSLSADPATEIALSIMQNALALF